MKENEHYVIGGDFGSDSVRIVVLDAANGNVAGSHVSYYPRWKKGLYCNPKENKFRQHPLDYIESLTEAVEGALQGKKDIASKVRGICIDTTGSTPVLTDKEGTPLALTNEFAEESDAMFVLWKDHTAIKEASQINQLAHSWSPDYTTYCGGTYSSEWFWSKLLHVLKNEKVRDAAYSAVEHCDWIVALITNTTALDVIKRSRCAAGHKCMWHASWGGYPSDEFLSRLDPKLKQIRDTLGEKTYTTDVVAGYLSKEWSAKFGLPEGIPVCVGAYDAHIGAMGGDCAPHVMVKSIGTSTCDVVIGEKSAKEEVVQGICGQVDGSVVSGYIGYEAGQSAYGDYYAWFRNVVLWPTEHLVGHDEVLEKKVLRELESAAQKLPLTENDPVALDWINGRRTPDANQNLTAYMEGITLGTDAPSLMKMLLESTAFGARAIIECYERGHVSIDKIVAIGGVARKSFFGMQILADVTGREIQVTAGDQSCAIGSAVFAATAAGLYPDLFSAQRALSAGIERIHKPIAEHQRIYEILYKKYQQLGHFAESQVQKM